MTKILMVKLLNIEIDDIKEILYFIRTFRNTHIQIFRRYKHAGFPIIINEHFESTNPNIDSASLIFTDKNNPLNPTPLPFSIHFIINYESLITRLQKFLARILWNKSQCIEKRLEGVLPPNIYTHKLCPNEKIKLSNLINVFNHDNPNYIIRDQLRFKTKLDSTTSPWYFY